MRGKDLALTLTAVGVGTWFALRARRWLQEYDVRGKTVLITGGSRGLGLVLAREWLREGARVVICARQEEELQRAEADLAQHGGHVLAVPCDVTVPEQVAQLVETVRGHWGRIDVLLNNAGIITTGPVETMTLADFQEAMRTNFWASVYTILAVLPEMRQRQEGRIVNITSIGGKVSVPHLLPYSASKFALVGLSEGLRSELAQEGITVTTVCPGLMRTGSPRNANFKGNHQAEYAWFSISDSLPGLSMAAESAARQIIRACKRGEAEVILSVPAQFAVTFHGLFPGLTADLLGVVNRWLPRAGAGGQEGKPGRDSESAWSPSWLTTLTERAAQRNNEMAPSDRAASFAQPTPQAGPARA